MSGLIVAVLIVSVAAAGTAGGAATRYERYGPARHRGPAGAAAIVSLSLAVALALTVFGVVTLQADGAAWRLLGGACAGGLFGGLVAARGVDHYLVLHSGRAALTAVGADLRAVARGTAALLSRVPWQPVADAVSGGSDELRRRLPADRPRG